MGYGTISGTVSALGDSIISASAQTLVYAIEVEGFNYGEVNPDVSGCYQLLLPTPTDYNVYTSAYGYTPQSARPISLFDSDLQVQNFVLPAAAAISGTVIDNMTGSPVSGVNMYAVQTDDIDYGWGIDITDSMGQYLITDLSAINNENASGTSYDVYADALNYDLQVQSIVVSPNTQIEVDFALDLTL